MNAEHIVDRCPTCGGQTLFIGTGGYLTCSLIGCTEPGVGAAIAKLKDRLRRAQASLSFEDLRLVNVERVSTAFEGHTLESWSETDWACAAAGEIGEMCNMVKKRRRGEAIPDVEVAKEMADTVIYLDILAARMGIVLGEAVRQKFNEVSARRNCAVRLPEAQVA